jgi:DNA repair exonuclease SbcCD ATPase subunit
LAEVAAQNEAALAQQTELRFNLDVLRELEKAYGRSGIPVLLLESLYVPQIEREANAVLAAWGVPYTVELVTQREQKTTDKLKDTLEVVVHSPDGPRRFSTYSGGERDRVSVALRISLARTIASHRGHALEVFALDELPHLDEAGVEKLAELLAELQREIPCVLFISHDTDLSDAFDQRVVVVREGGRSRIEVAA